MVNEFTWYRRCAYQDDPRKMDSLRGIFNEHKRLLFARGKVGSSLVPLRPLVVDLAFNLLRRRGCGSTSPASTSVRWEEEICCRLAWIFGGQ